MTKELWAAAGAELLTGSFPPVSEALFCDALLSIAAGEDRKATLELGVACEIEITALLEALARQSLQSPAKADYLRREMRGNWVSFADKLEKCTLSLGLPNPTQFIAGVPHNWVDTVKKLYRTRNAIAHGRELGAETIRVGKAVPAANALFKYTRAARHGAGLWTYALPSSTPFPEQLIGIME